MSYSMHEESRIRYALTACYSPLDTLSHAAYTSHACTNPGIPHRITAPRASYNGYYLSFPS
ncbi:hypothetical protein CO2235_200098 [Cupriavidus oxalaticus]|uniref:Uncharacterized protein n=1 Tax=Cupriavidus oxalaticus TaxID=96344 RepID=A0A976GA37_9BURK|nr:hypothetical protein CO2235_200098 [Cupriavidus oxalaticus]